MSFLTLLNPKWLFSHSEQVLEPVKFYKGIEDNITYHFFTPKNFISGQKSRNYAYWFTDYMYANLIALDAINFKINVWNILKVIFYGIIYFIFPKLCKYKKSKSLLHTNYQIVRYVFDTYNIHPVKLFYITLFEKIKTNITLYAVSDYNHSSLIEMQILDLYYLKLKNVLKFVNKQIFNGVNMKSLNSLRFILNVYLKKQIAAYDFNKRNPELYKKEKFKYSTFKISNKYIHSYFKTCTIPFRIVCSDFNFSVGKFVESLNFSDKLYNDCFLKPEIIKLSEDKNFRKNYNILFHIHGGGFMANTSHQHQNYLIYWANRLKNTIIISIDYSLCPEFTFEQQIQECFIIYFKTICLNQIFYENHDEFGYFKVNKVIFAGDSAGGLIGMNLIKKLLKLNLRIPDFCLYIYPCK